MSSFLDVYPEDYTILGTFSLAVYKDIIINGSYVESLLFKKTCHPTPYPL